MTEIPRIDPRSNPDEVGDEGDLWQQYLDGLVPLEALPPEDQARARRAGLA